MRRLLARLLCLLLPVLFAGAAVAQTAAGDEAAMLVADRVYLEGRERVVAEGNVEALQNGTRLRASRIVYDRRTERLVVDGPIVITDPGTDGVLLADAAQLDRDLQNGIVKGARIVLNQQLQLAALQLDRVNGRYGQLYKATVSSCHVCDGRPPLWQIRAKRVIHDQQERQLWFDDARFEVMGMPIFWFPRLRLPDPTLDRSRGFLIPTLRRNSRLSTGLKLPYFIPIGRDRDITLTPYLSPETRTLELRYRQAFRTGRIEFETSLSRDDLRPGETRAYIEGGGRFDLPRGFVLTFDVEAVTDDTYSTEYGLSPKDRLDSEIAVTRVRRDEYIRAALTHYHSLRVNEDNGHIPSIIGDVSYERRFFPARLGGELRLGLDAHGHYRYSTTPFDGGDADTITDGRDVGRLTVDAAWLNTWTLPLGIRAGVEAGVSIDSFRTAQDITLPASQTGVVPRLGVTLRWPFVRHAPTGTTDVIEPMVQYAWSGSDRLNVANDESTRVEFDEGNLLSLSRFPAPDRREHGHRAAVGLSWTRFVPGGWQSRLTMGQIFREDADPAFTTTSGLAGSVSDLLLAGQFKAPGGFGLTARGVFAKQLDVHKAEARAYWSNRRVNFGASYSWLDADPAEERLTNVSEYAIDGTFRISDRWSGSVEWRYDIVRDDTAQAGFGLMYQNECVEMALSLSRRYTSSVNLAPSTDVSFTIGLRGFSADTGAKRLSRTCK